MNKRFIGVWSLLGGAMLLNGCGHTLQGAQQDATRDTQAVGTAAQTAEVKTKAAAQKAGAAVESVPQNIDSATVVTPKVKFAIVRDPVLNDPRNQINVNSHDKVTHLTGHVADASMKQRATEDAETVLNKEHPDYKVSDELTVTSSP